MRQVHLHHQRSSQIYSLRVLRRVSALSNSSLPSPFPSSPRLSISCNYTKSFLSLRNKRSGGGAMGTTELGPGDLRHVESMSHTPSGAGKIDKLNAVILGDSLASEEDDLIFPSVQFSQSALISSPQQVSVLVSLSHLLQLNSVLYVFRIPFCCNL
jgi:hypothetical protein